MREFDAASVALSRAFATPAERSAACTAYVVLWKHCFILAAKQTQSLNFYIKMAMSLTIILASAGGGWAGRGVWTYAAVAAGAAAVAIAWRACRRLRQTTLLAPCAWAVGSLLAVMIDVGGSGGWRTADAHLHYLAGVSTVAPFVALLGAKRPQHRAWQWIVAALLLLLALQSLKAIVIDRGVPPALHLAWRWLLAVVVSAQLMNYLLTRNFLAAGLVFVGQVFLLAEQLPGASWLPEPRGTWGLSLLSAGVLAAASIWRRRSGPCVPPPTSNDPAALDRAWLAFRDAYGALWALRVAERINAASRERGGVARLRWSGLQMNGQEKVASLCKLFRAILARFVAHPSD